MRISDWSSDVCSSDLSHALQIEEIRDVSRRDKIRALVRPAEVGRLVNQIGLVADIPADLPHVRRSPDPRDDFLLGLCEAGRADWLIKGNKDDLLALERPGSSRIVTAETLADPQDRKSGGEGKRGEGR